MAFFTLATRVSLSVFLTGLAGVVGVLIAWLTFGYFVFTQNTFALTSGFAIGGSAGIGAAVAWWNTESAPRERALDTVLTIIAVLASAWFGYWLAVLRGPEIVYMTRGVVGGYVGVWDSLTISTYIYFASVLGGTVLAGAIYLRRALPRHEL